MGNQASNEKGNVEWVPDDAVVDCSKCKTKFSVTIRKHHCRNCGEIFCSTCSSHRVRLDNGPRTVRVCDSCVLKATLADKKKARTVTENSDPDLRVEVRNKWQTITATNSGSGTFEDLSSPDMSAAHYSTSAPTTNHLPTLLRMSDGPKEEGTLSPTISEENALPPVDPSNWNWSLERKAPCIQVSSDNQIASRDPFAKAHNPSILGEESFTKEKTCYRVKVISIGKFVGIGVGSGSLVVDQGAILGKQADCPNAAYFSQGESIHKLHTPGEPYKKADKIKPGDYVDVHVDFDQNRVNFWLNQKYQGHLPLKLEEGNVFPAVNLASASQVEFWAPAKKESTPASVDLQVRQEIANMDVVAKHPLKRIESLQEGSQSVVNLLANEEDRPDILKKEEVVEKKEEVEKEEPSVESSVEENLNKEI